MDAIATRETVKTSAPATAVAHAWLREALYHELSMLAAQRRLHVDAYTADIVTSVLLLGVADELIERAKSSFLS